MFGAYRTNVKSGIAEVSKSKPTWERKAPSNTTKKPFANKTQQSLPLNASSSPLHSIHLMLCIRGKRSSVPSYSSETICFVCAFSVCVTIFFNSSNISFYILRRCSSSYIPEDRHRAFNIASYNKNNNRNDFLVCLWCPVLCSFSKIHHNIVLSSSGA